MRTTIDSAGRLVIPKALRDEVGLAAGAPVEVRVAAGRIEIEPAPLPVKLVRKGRLLVAIPDQPVPPLTTKVVERTRARLRRERASRG
jgi:AbrB family looped-hinge helix DNA binding protein